MRVSAVDRLPHEIWHQISITLRDHLRCPHGSAIAFDDYPCELYKLTAWESPWSSPPCFIATQFRVKSLSETCRFLRTLLQPVLYETISIDGRDPERITHTLSNRQDFLPHVHNLYLHHAFHNKAGRTAFVDQLVPHLHRLRVLRIGDVMITPTISQFIQASQSLREVYLSAYQWPDGTPGDHLEASPSSGQFTNISISTKQDALLLVPTVTTLSLFIEAVYDIIPLLDRGVLLSEWGG